MGMGALASIGISLFSNGTATPMIAIMGVTSVAGFLILLVGRRKIAKG
jgi:DHA1 family bicyclomycin/chloramphenicol resistance-like MFS transporter